MKLTCDHRGRVYFDSDEPSRFPGESDRMFRDRLRRIMAGPRGVRVLDVLDGDPVMRDEVRRAVVGERAYRRLYLDTAAGEDLDDAAGVAGVVRGDIAAPVR